jgi:hypothetical protein
MPPAPYAGHGHRLGCPRARPVLGSCFHRPGVWVRQPWPMRRLMSDQPLNPWCCKKKSDGLSYQSAPRHRARMGGQSAAAHGKQAR